MKSKVKIWCDGSCNNITNLHGGYGIYIEKGDIISQWSGGQYIFTTSPRMELKSAVMALKHCDKDDIVDLYSDCAYVVNCIQKGWIFRWEKEYWRGRKNVDLLKQLLIQYRRVGTKVRFHWVKGHAESTENHIVDALAKIGAHQEETIIDEGSEVYLKTLKTPELHKHTYYNRI